LFVRASREEWDVYKVATLSQATSGGATIYGFLFYCGGRGTRGATVGRRIRLVHCSIAGTRDGLPPVIRVGRGRRIGWMRFAE